MFYAGPVLLKDPTNDLARKGLQNSSNLRPSLNLSLFEGKTHNYLAS